MTVILFIINASYLFIIFGLPVVTLLWPKFPTWPEGFLSRLALTVIATWLLMIIFRYFSLPYAITEIRATGNTSFDGSGGSAMLLAYGWIFSFFGCVPAIIIRAIVDLYMKRKNRPNKAAHTNPLHAE